MAINSFSADRANTLLERANNGINNINTLLDYTKQTVENAATVKDNFHTIKNDVTDLFTNNEKQSTAVNNVNNSVNNTVNNSISNVKQKVSIMETIKLYLGKPVFWVCVACIGVAVFFWKKCKRRR